ncbi:hypothetical protein Tco_1580560 [Tanacetum coccineum]
MMVQPQEEMGEGSEIPTDPHHTPIITQPSTSQPQKKQSRRKQRKDTEVSQPSGLTEPVVDEKIKKVVLALETTKTNQALEIDSLIRRVKKLEKKASKRTHKLKRLYKVGLSAKVISSDDEGLGDQEDASKKGRKIANIDADIEVTLIDKSQGRNDDLVFDTGVFDGEEVFVALKLQAQLQDELEQEEKLVRQNKEEANIALIESWDNIQAKIDADYQMAQQLQIEEQEQLSIKEKSRLFVQLLEARKKHFVEIRAREKRNKPPTQA